MITTFGRRFVLGIGLAGIVTLVLAASPADAADRGGHAGGARAAGAGAGAGSRAPRGDYTRHTERARTENGHTRHDEVTNAAGRSATRDASVVNDRASGTRTRNVDVAGPNDRHATRSDVTQRTADGFTRSTSVTNPNGSTATRDVTASYDPATKTVTKDVSVDREPRPRPTDGTN